MDLGSECSAPESEEENVGENVSENNGSSANENIELGSDGNSDANASTPDPKGTFVEEAVHPTGTPATKGFGLKKWRRIRRDVVKDPSSCVDSSRVLKRGLSGNANLTKSQPFLRDAKQNSEGSIGSSNMFRHAGFSDGYAIHVSSSDTRYALGSGFAAGTDSENSEDRSSKSSTAASAPKLRYDLPVGLGHVREKSRNKNMNSKNLASSAQRVQQAKGQIESSKKPRGERAKMEKENSHSSMESDSRSSNIKRGIFTVTSNGKHSSRPNICEYGGNSDEALTNDHFHQDVQTGYYNENMGEHEDLLPENSAANLSWEAKEEKSENNLSSTVEDPLIESIYSLQAVQEALEEEVQKFGEIGNGPLSPDNDTTKCSSAAAVDKSYLSGQSGIEGIKETASSSLELKVLSLTQNVNILESKLEEFALKDSRIAELETALGIGKFPKEESTCTIDSSQEKYTEVESELETLFRQKIEAEVEFLVIAKMMDNLKVAAGFQLTLLKEQETLSGNQAQVLNKLGEAESKASLLKNKADWLEKYCDDTLGIEETFMMEKGVCKVTFCLFVQFMLLVSVFWLFVSRLSPNSGVVPT